MEYSTVDELFAAVARRLGEPGYARTYDIESEFEAEVWDRLRTMFGANAPDSCLTSHSKLEGRSPEAWKAFCREKPGPDVDVLGSKNRLDIVVKCPDLGTIGVEVKCLGEGGHAGKLTQGIGQAILALAHRHRTLLVMHCGTVGKEERGQLRSITEKICAGTRMVVIVAP